MSTHFLTFTPPPRPPSKALSLWPSFPSHSTLHPPPRTHIPPLSLSNRAPLQPSTTLHSPSTQSKLEAAEAELDTLRASLAAAKERDAFRVAYRHKASLDEALALLSLRAQSWPKDMQDVLSRCVLCAGSVCVLCVSHSFRLLPSLSMCAPPPAHIPLRN